MNNKVCVVGAGYWGKNHIRTLHELGVLGGIVESNTEVILGLHKKYSDNLIFQTLDDALEKDEFTGFTVATPAETHYEIAKKIILAGKHLLVEKPFTLTIEHAEELVNLADRQAINLMVGHVMLFHPAIIKTKELITSGKIGKLQYIYSNRLNLGQVRTEENVFWSLAPHDVSIFQYLTNSFPITIESNGSSFLQEGIHDSTITQLKYPNGVEGHIFVSWLHPFKEHRLIAIGTEGMLSFEDSKEKKPLKYYNKKFEIKNKVPEKVDGLIENINYEQIKPLTKELKYFVDHLGPSKPKKANGSQAIEVTKILVEASSQLKQYEK